MAGYASLTIRDYNGEKSVSNLTIGDITAVSIAGALSDWGDYRTAVDSIIIGVIAKETMKVFDTNLSNDLAASPQAQREAKWLVVYEDNLPFFDDPVNAIPNEGYRKVFTFEIATPDLTLLVANTDRMNIATGAGQTFVTAFEAIARSPYGGTVNVLYVQHVGRNL